MLIADEVHNLGGGSFFASPPLRVAYRLGLSATPERQYDPDGTVRLSECFGNVIFKFGLAEATGVCLVPYDYHLHPVGLKHHELEEYRRLSDHIRRLGLVADPQLLDKKEERLQLLLNRRRLVLEATEGKRDDDVKRLIRDELARCDNSQP